MSTFDYRLPGYYFITICTRDRLHLFGSVTDGGMHPNAAGQMVHATWDDVVHLHPGTAVDIDIVLPDHIHAIVVLDADPKRTLSLPDLVQRYKTLTTKRYTYGVRDQNWKRFAKQLWQTSFYDRVIRDEAELNTKREYISGNVARWELRAAASKNG